MCGSLLSKFKTKSNKVSTDPLQPSSALKKTNLEEDILSEEEDTLEDKMTLVSETSETIRILNHPKDTSIATKSLESTTPTKTAEENLPHSVCVCSSVTGLEQTYAGPDSTSLVYCKSSVGFALENAGSAECELSVGLEQKNPGLDSGPLFHCESYLDLEQKNTCPDSGSSVECKSCAGTEHHQTESDSGFAFECKSNAGSQKKANSNPTSPAKCESIALEQIIKEPDSGSVTVECKSAARLEQTDRESYFGSAAKFESPVAAKMRKETTSGFTVQCEFVASLGPTKNESNFGSATKCESPASEQTRKEPVSGLIGKCKSAVSPEQTKNESDFGSTTEYDSKTEVQIKGIATNTTTVKRTSDPSFPSMDGHAKVEMRLEQTEEITIVIQNDVDSGSVKNYTYLETVIRPPENDKLRSATRGTLTAVQSGLCSGSLAQKPVEGKVSVLSKPPSTIPRDLVAIAKTEKEQQDKKTTKEDLTPTRSATQSPAYPILLSTNREAFIALARKELEERIMKMTADQIASCAAVSNAHAQSSVDPTFLSTNRELLLAMAREELDKRILQMTAQQKGPAAMATENSDQPTKQKTALFTNREVALAKPGTKVRKTFKEKIAALRRSLTSRDAVRSIVLGETENSIAFKVVVGSKRKQTVIPSARLPFNLRRLDDPPPLTAEVFEAKLRRAQENRLRELERVRASARNMVWSPDPKKVNDT